MFCEKFTIIRHHTECSLSYEKMELSAAEIWAVAFKNALSRHLLRYSTQSNFFIAGQSCHRY